MSKGGRIETYSHDRFAAAVHHARVRKGLTVREVAEQMCDLAGYQPTEEALCKICTLLIDIETSGAYREHVLFRPLCKVLGIRRW